LAALHVLTIQIDDSGSWAAILSESDGFWKVVVHALGLECHHDLAVLDVLLLDEP
jgi:hypothetical protein